jgi:hypothetical protein
MRAAVLLAVLGSGAVLAAAEIIRVTSIARDGRILVSFEMKDGFTRDIQDAISSGLTTTFTYDVELRRGAAVWLDRTVASARVTASVRYDNLTRRYQVARTQDGRVEDTRIIEDIAVVQRWLTEFERLSLFSTAPLEPNADYYVRVRVRMRPHNSMFFLPWDRAAASGMAKFTFIP